MAHEVYRHRQPVGKEEHGHSEQCEYVNNHGPACECSDDPAGPNRYDVAKAMKFNGWKHDSTFPRPENAWYREHGPHCIQLTRLISGWQLRWDKKNGLTYMERGSFATLTDALNYFWDWMAERVDESSKVAWEHGAMKNQLEQAGIEPRRLGVHPQPTTTRPGLLKHQVTAIMDERGGE